MIFKSPYTKPAFFLYILIHFTILNTKPGLEKAGVITMLKKGFQVTMMIFCLSLAACAPKQITKDCDLPGIWVETEEVNSSITPIIQIDGTPSMQGFVTIPTSRYIRTLRLIDTVVTTAFANSQPPQYYRFGMARSRFTDESSSLSAQKPWFYDRTLEKLLDADLDVAIAPVEGNPREQISIIIVDLYQQDGEIARVLNSLRVNYLEKGLAVGILAVKSEFDGIVYDIGLNNESVQYRTTQNQPEGFQPFYVLVLSTYENVAHFFDRIKTASQSEGLNFTDDKFVIFYPRFLSEPLRLNIDPNPGNFNNVDGIRRLHTINDGNVMVSVGDRQTTEILMLTNPNSQDKKIPYQIPYQGLPYLLPINDIQVEVSPSIYNSEDRSFVPFNPNPIQFHNWNIDGNKLNFDINFNTRVMTSGVYWFTVDLSPKSLQSPPWWTEWNLRENEPFKGGTTYNLLPFMENLKKLNLELHQDTGMGRLCYLLHQNF